MNPHDTLGGTRHPARTLATCAALALATLSLPAQALVVDSAIGSSGAVVGTAHALDQQLAIDLRFEAPGSFQVVLQLQGADLGQWLGMNAVVTLGNGLQIQAMTLATAGLDIALDGSVTPQLGQLQTIDGSGTDLRVLRFSPAESWGVDLGNPFAQPGGQDWLFTAVSGLTAGDTATLALSVSAVPEPASATLWLAALAGLGGVAFMRRGQRSKA